MVNTQALHQGLELFRANWPQRFADHDSYSRLMALYAIGCEDLSDDEFLQACKGGIKASTFMPTPAELNHWIRPPIALQTPRDPELDYRPVNTPSQGGAAPLQLGVPAKTPAERQAEWDRMKAELRAKWDGMKAAEQSAPLPGPGYVGIDRRARKRRPKPADYQEREMAEVHLDGVAAGLAAGVEQWHRQASVLRAALSWPTSGVTH